MDGFLASVLCNEFIDECVLPARWKETIMWKRGQSCCKPHQSESSKGSALNWKRKQTAFPFREIFWLQFLFFCQFPGDGMLAKIPYILLRQRERTRNMFIAAGSLPPIITVRSPLYLSSSSKKMFHVWSVWSFCKRNYVTHLSTQFAITLSK